MNVQTAIASLVKYGLATGLIRDEDAIYTANRLLEILKIDVLDSEAQMAIEEFMAEGAQDEETKAMLTASLDGILQTLCGYAYEHGLIEGDSVAYTDLFDTALMGVLTMRPSEVTRQFEKLFAQDPRRATDWYYRFSCDTNYIRRDRIVKDVKWTAPTVYGDLDITINLSKPEKDPKAIAAALKSVQAAYPKCQLCRENVGYAGRLDHPARQNHRIIPVQVGGGSWYFQYSPYVYYNEHCIVFNGEHVPMKIDRSTFVKLLDFVRAFPHYFIGSNADLPIVGGSILTHDHFQGGRYEFAMAKAPVEETLVFTGYEDVAAGIVKWPMSVIRLSSPDTSRLVDLADRILQTWRGYTDEQAFIFAETDGEPHNTITPIARKRGENFELDLVLRDNITTKEHPLGVFHPHAQLHHIKKENIGLIEVMGLAVLPARLKRELEDLKCAILEGRDIRADEELAKHADWTDELREKYPNLAGRDPEELGEILRTEVGLVFMQVLEDAGVYKRTPEGKAEFLRFAAKVND